MTVEVNRTRALLMVIGVVALATLMVGCTLIVATNALLGSSGVRGGVEMTEYATVDDWPDAASFADRFQLDLPPSTRAVRLASSGFQEPIYHLRFTVDAEDAVLVATSVGCGGLLPQPVSNLPRALVDDLDWWVPGQATTYQACQGAATPGRIQDVFLDQSPADAVDVYVLVVYL